MSCHSTCLIQPQEISKCFEALPIVLMLHTWQPALQFTEMATYFHNGSQALMHHRGSGRAVAPVNTSTTYPDTHMLQLLGDKLGEV